MTKKILIVFALGFLFASSTISAQTGTLTGSITDQENGDPLIGAAIFIEALQKGSQSDINGEYQIRGIEYGRYTVRVSFIGYKTFTTEVELSAPELNLDIELESQFYGFDEIVVTGYGTLERKAFTGTVSTVRADKIADVPVASIEQALLGNASGLVVNSATGTPGAEQEIRIRGISSINIDTDPLFVIDGVPVIAGENTQSTATSSLGILSSLNSADIESVSVLKDAASTAPYGARGTNGVVVITTKSGSNNGTTYSLKMQRGVNTRAVEGETPMNAFDYEDYFQASTGASLMDFQLWDGIIDTDWGAVVQNDNAIQEEYSLSASGGNQTTQFYVSAGIFGQEGQLIGSALDRYSGTFDINHKLDEKVSLRNSLSGSFVEQDGILEGGGFFGSPVLAEYFMLPTDRALNEDGTPNITTLNTNVFNPLFIQTNDLDRKRNFRARNNTKLDILLTESLEFSSRFSVDYIQTEEKYYNNVSYGDAVNISGSVDDYSTRNFNYVWQNSLKYLWSPSGKHDFTFNIITENQRNYNYTLNGYGEGIAAPGLFNLATVASPQDVFSQSEDWANLSFTGLTNYSFNDRLFIDANYRYEGSSRFSEDNRWGAFYALGVGYVLSELSFFEEIDAIDFLKVRASYGKTGNANVDLNVYQAVVEFESYNNQANIQPSQLGNLDLTWETAKSLDLGIEFELLNTLSSNITFFRKDSENLLFDVPLSFTTGHDGQTQNLGKLYNQGIEIEANANLIRSNDFNWNLGFNFTSLKNEVTELPKDGNGNDIEVTTGTRYTAVVGYEVNAWFLREWAGVDPDTGDPLWYMDDGNGGRTTTNVYNQADRYYQGGSALPTKFGGINTRFDIKNFYVSANLYYSFGNYIFDDWAFYLRSDGAFAGSFGQYSRQSDFWTADNPSAENPRPVFGGNQNSNSASSRFLYDGDFLRLKTVNLGYNIPVSLTSQLGIKKATVYFVGQNLWTYVFDEDLNFDPEVQANGFTDLRAAPLKSVTFGINVNF